MGPGIFSKKVHFLRKCPVVALDEVEVKNQIKPAAQAAGADPS